MPALLYGTAWKKERTTELVLQALRAGFRGIDTACQLKHYQEKLVGDAVRQAIEAKLITRQDLFLQTKFTSRDGQDHRLPYDPAAPVGTQVAQSFATSQTNLQTEYVDSLVLHGPMRTFGQTLEVWRAFETLHDSGKARQLGISNCYDVDYLVHLWTEARIKPTVVQNRFHAETNYDSDIRAFCKEREITYQSFWTLTANPDVIRSKAVKKVALRLAVTPEQAFFAFVMHLGVTPLTGTTSEAHMTQDLAVPSLALTETEVRDISALLH